MLKVISKEYLLYLIWKITGRRQGVDIFLSRLLKQRKHLQEFDASQCIPHFFETEVKLRCPPIGKWSTPLIDVFIILKAAIGFQSKRILELGTFRGNTTRLLAENTSLETTICTVDLDPRQGLAYKGLPVEMKITQKTGKINLRLFEVNEKFDLIFIDAAHDFDSVMHDTEVAMHLLDEGGVIFWHDYQQNTFFDGVSRVPEALLEFSKKYPIVAISGTWLAMYSLYPEWTTSSMLAKGSSSFSSELWLDTRLRG